MVFRSLPYLPCPTDSLHGARIDRVSAIARFALVRPDHIRFVVYKLKNFGADLGAMTAADAELFINHWLMRHGGPPRGKRTKGAASSTRRPLVQFAFLSLKSIFEKIIPGQMPVNAAKIKKLPGRYKNQ
jgi:hypothetical protein